MKPKTFHLILIIIAVLVYLPVLATPAHAQGNLPQNATQLVPWLIAIVSGSGFSAWLASFATSALKSWTKKVKFLGGKDVTVISGLWSKLVVAILIGLLGQFATAFTPIAGFLDSTGLWAVFVGALFIAQKYYLSDKPMNNVVVHNNG